MLQQFKKTTNFEIQKGMLIPVTAISHLLNGKLMLNELKKISLKNEIFSFMEGRDNTTIRDIVEQFDLEPEQVIKILDEMQKEGKIRQT